MKKTFTNILSTTIEYLPVVVAAGLIAILLGLAIVRGQTAATGTAAPSWAAIALGSALVVIGALAIAAPLTRSFLDQRQATAEQEQARDTETVEQARAVAEGEPAADDIDDERSPK
jgi:hypothetical protein